MAGHAIMIKTMFENKKLFFLCVYAPVLAVNRMLLLNKLCDVISGVDDDGFLFLGVGGGGLIALLRLS